MVEKRLCWPRKEGDDLKMVLWTRIAGMSQMKEAR